MFHQAIIKRSVKVQSVSIKKCKAERMEIVQLKLSTNWKQKEIADS
jgi:hypothetical protein